MSQGLDSMEDTLLDELASTIETVRSADLQIRKSVESGQWHEACRFCAGLVRWLKQKRIAVDAISERLIDISHTDAGQAIRIQRCVDMSTHLSSLLSKHLPTYQRVLAGLAERTSDRQALPG